MSFTVRKAVRKNLPLKIGISGLSGSGKTYSALLLAKGLAGTGKVAVLDTENRRSEYYADVTDFDIVPFAEPYSPDRYVQAIKQLEKEYAVIIIDSASHEWDGIGGCLDMSKAKGGKFQDWGIISPLHKKFTDALLGSPAHIIATVRQKKEFSMGEGNNGRTKVEAVGTKLVQRDNFEYEFAVLFEVQMNHKALASKDNTRLFTTEVPFTLDEQTGIRLREWNEKGQVAPKTQEIPGTNTAVTTISEAQAKKLWAVAKEHKWSTDEVKWLLSKYKVTQSSEIRWDEFDGVLAWLEMGYQKAFAQSQQRANS
jgi:hypothetical protein